MALRTDFRLKKEEIRELIRPMGACIASNRITIDGARVGTMQREPKRRDIDSGWRFFAGDEDAAYRANTDNFQLYDVNTICNYDHDIIPFLYALPGQLFDREPSTGRFVEARDSAPDAKAAGLPPGVHVVSGDEALNEYWSLALPTPFRRRHERGSIVLWRPRLTFWISLFTAGREPFDKRVRGLVALISPSAFDAHFDDDGPLYRIRYRLREDTTDAGVPSLYIFRVAPTGHLQAGIYGDGEPEIEDAQAIADTIRFTVAGL